MTGEQLKLEGQLLVEDTNAAFVKTMRSIAEGISLLKGSVTSDDLRAAAAKAGLAPTHPNCWGSILRGPHWTIIGRTKSAVPGNHHREIRIWRYEP